MKTVLRSLLLLSILASFLIAGLWLGPLARSTYVYLFPRPAFSTGDFSTIYRETGTSVVIFTTSTCPYCKRARDMLQHRGIVFHDFVIDQSPDAHKRFTELGGSGVPLLLIGDRKIVGYREDAIAQSLRALTTDAPR